MFAFSSSPRDGPAAAAAAAAAAAEATPTAPAPSSDHHHDDHSFQHRPRNWEGQADGGFWVSPSSNNTTTSHTSGHHAGDAGDAAALFFPSSFSRASLFHSLQRFYSAICRPWLQPLSLLNHVGAVTAGMSPCERAQASRDAMVVLHLAAALAVLEVCHAVRLSRRARRLASALRRRRQPPPHPPRQQRTDIAIEKDKESQHQQGKEMEEGKGAVGGTPLTLPPSLDRTETGSQALTETTQSCTRVGSSVDTSANTTPPTLIATFSTSHAPLPRDSHESHEYPVPLDGKKAGMKVHHDEKEKPKVPEEAEEKKESATRGHRLVTYWSLVSTAVQDGKRKQPSPAIAPADILSTAAQLSKSDATSTEGGCENISTSSPLGRQDTLFALPDSLCFRMNTVAQNYLHGKAADSPTTATVGWTSSWSTLFLLWTDAVRYSVNTDEIRTLLLSFPDNLFNEVNQGPVPPQEKNGVLKPATGSQELRVAIANLAVAWRLTLLRRVYDALVMHEDTQRCEEELEELQTYGALLYRRCIAPWGRAEGIGAEDKNKNSDGWDETTEGKESRPFLAFSPPRAWLLMSVSLQQLRRLSHRLTLRSVGSLFRYMYASSKSKYLAGAMLMALTGLSSRVTAAGMRAREAVAQVLGAYFYPRQCTSDEDCSGSRQGGRQRHLSPSSSNCGEGSLSSDDPNSSLFLAQVLSLCAFELIRLTVNTVLLKASRQFINVTASQRRDAVKAQLYSALTHMPLSFYDLHSYDDIEEMVYYVNDLEGVDVHVHQYVFTAATTFMATRLALTPLNKEARVLVVGSVAAAYGIQWLGTVLGRWYTRRRQQQLAAAAHEKHNNNSADEDDEEEDADLEAAGGARLSVLTSDSHGGRVDGDAQEAENTSSANCRDGVMLRGLEIVAALPQLRPYGADVALMAWWNNYVARRTHGKGKGKGSCASASGVLGSLLEDTHSHVLPAMGSAVLTFVDWMLPLLTSVYGAQTAARGQYVGPATASGRLLDATNAVKAAVEAALDARRVLEVVLQNSYKACVIERILCPRFWESTAAEDIDRVGTYAQQHSWVESVLVPPPVQLLRRLSAMSTNSFVVASASAHSKKPYKRLMVVRVRVCGLQFSYPSNPTVPVFPQPLSADLILQDRVTGRGRLVCLTGPSGHGKSTMLHLLLGLYTGYRHVGSGNGSSHSSCPPIEVHLTYKTPSATTVAAVAAATAAFSSSSSLSKEQHQQQNEDEEKEAQPRQQQQQQPVIRSPTASGAFADEEYVVSLAAIPCDVLRGQFFSYVPQYPTIFAGATIAHNITLSPYVSLEETALLAKAQACADEAHCDYIRRFPQGLLTPVGDAASLWSGTATAEGGGLVRLSGGQAQRLMVARALYHGGGVLLMDEPTASLDGATKLEMLKEWRQLLDNGAVKGIICATHDEAVIAAADEVVSLLPSSTQVGEESGSSSEDKDTV